jgi:hypothetical protein
MGRRGLRGERMSWLITPLVDRTKAGTLARAIDVLLGFPRVHPERELVRIGQGPHAAIVRTEAQCAVMLDATRIAVGVDAAVLALVGRQVTIDAQSVRVRVDDPGWTVVATLPAGTWTPLTARDGGAGSQTGEPIP